MGTETTHYTDDGEKKTDTSKNAVYIGPNSVSDFDETCEHTTEKLKTEWGSLNVDVYTLKNEYSGVESTSKIYIYADLEIKITYEVKSSDDSFSSEYELTSLKLNREDVDPEDIQAFIGITN